MTIDEAINILKQYVDYDNPDVPDFYTMEEAIKVIIEALEQEPMREATQEEREGVDQYIGSIAEPCDDCIRREDALMALTGEWIEPTDELIRRFIRRIRKLPPVTPAEKVGRWEWVQYDGNPNIGNWHCSECRTIFIEGTIKKEKDSIPFYKYCPQCGAKMKEGD